MAADRLPSIGPLLRLDPPEHERAFWRSHTFRTAARSCDLWALYITLIVNGLYLRWHHQLTATSLQHAYVAFDIAAVLLQQLWALRAPHHYYELRWRFVWIIRLAHLLMFASIPRLTNRILETPDALSRLKLIVQPPAPALVASPTTELLMAMRYLPLASSSAIAFIHSITTPLPFLPQVAIHLAYTLLAALFQLRPALAILNLLPAQPFQQLCHALNLSLQLTSTTLVGSAVDLGHATRECNARAKVLLVLFTDLYCCLLLPAYVAYRYEGAIKQRYVEALQHARLEALRADGGASGGGAVLLQREEDLELVVDELVQNMAEVAWPTLLDVLVGVFLAAIGWVAVLMVHSPVEAAASHA